MTTKHTRMNCAQGDWALITHCPNGNVGKIIQCVEFIGEHQVTYAGIPITELHWLIEPDIKAPDGSMINVVSDHQLRSLSEEDCW